MDIEVLIEQLNQYNQSIIFYQAGGEFADVCMDAATALSTLQSENEKLRNSRDRWRKCAEEFSAGVNQRDNETEKLQAENAEMQKQLNEFSEFLCHIIGEMSSENEKLRAELKSKVDLVFQQTKELDRRNLLLREQEAELEQVKNERDSARATLYWIKLHGLKED